jgi:hypothetical protein
MRQEPRELEFPYIPSCTAILQVGEPYSASDNRAYVLSLNEARNPEMAICYDEMINGSCGAGCIVTLQNDVISDPAMDSWGSDGGANLSD